VVEYIKKESETMNPQLPLLDEHTLIIDNSYLELLRCPRELLYKQGLRRVPAVPKAAQFFGQGLHIGLATRYSLCGSNEVTDSTPIMQAIVKHFGTNQPPVGDYRTLDFATQIIDAYDSTYRTEPFKIVRVVDKPIIECSFMEEMGYVEGYKVMYAGRLDLFVEDNEGTWVWDNKSAYMFGQSWDNEMKASPQFRGYMWAMNKVTGIMPRGFKVNGIRVRPPTKEAELNPAKRVRPNEDFRRLTEHIQPEEITEWAENTLEKVREVVLMFQRGVFPKHESMCVGKYGPCSFYDVCRLPAQNREEYLSSGLFEKYEWSPINLPK
jgi:hypothetical protein